MYVCVLHYIRTYIHTKTHTHTYQHPRYLGKTINLIHIDIIRRASTNFSSSIHAYRTASLLPHYIAGIYVCTCIYIYIYIYICMYLYKCISLYVYVCIYICMYVYIYIYIFIYIYIYICISKYDIYIYTYIHTYIYIILYRTAAFCPILLLVRHDSFTCDMTRPHTCGMTRSRVT